MKRDMELIRKILFKVEESEEADRHPGACVKITLGSDYPDENVISYHICLLQDIGLLESDDASDFQSHRCVIKGLTWQGHEFLDAIRHESIWEKTKERIKEYREIPIAIIKEVAVSLIRETLFTKEELT